MEILDLSEHIRILEELLLHQDFSNSPAALEGLLGDDFEEVNPDGKTVSRKSVIAWLLNKSPADRWEFSRFEVKQLAPDLVQATYHARQIFPEKPASKGAVHCSLWQERMLEKESEEAPGKAWQMIFHQSTRVAEKDE